MMEWIWPRHCDGHGYGSVGAGGEIKVGILMGGR